jgi:2-polyprenyl-3-methyl-5-hydroxy-6-metoxy-1,4-benzoquinol methylase
MNRRYFSLWREALPNPAFLALILEIRQTLKDCATVLDLGCGDNSPMRFLNTAKITGVDGYEPALTMAQARGTHDEYHLADVRKVDQLFGDRRFDACIALDVIEHLTKPDGLQMLAAIERLATKRVVIFTPNGFVPQQSKNGDLQEHLSGWLPDEMSKRGYRVIGMHGPKSLRGEYARLKHRPKALWGMASVMAHYFYTRQRPEKSFSIFCCKHLDGN